MSDKHDSRFKRWDDRRIAAKEHALHYLIRRPTSERSITRAHMMQCKLWARYWGEGVRRRRLEGERVNRQQARLRHASRIKHRCSVYGGCR